MKNDGMGEGVQGEGAQDGRAKRETHTERGREGEREAAGRDGIKNGCLFIHNFLFHSEGPAARRRTAQISPLHKSREGGGGGEVRSGEGRGGHGREHKGGGGDQAGDG